MKISIISTQASNWGGSELLFVSLVEEALAKDFEVQLVVNKDNTHHKLIKKVISRVASLVITPSESPVTNMIKKGVKQIKNKIAPFTLKKINEFSPDIILINQPNSSDASFNKLYFDFLKNTRFPYYLISHFNAEHNCYSIDDIQKLRQINKKAQKALFVSNRNRVRFEHQIAHKLENAAIIANHPFINQFKYQPYPSNQAVISFASVARLECNYKGQDILFEVLSTEIWKSRNWQLNLYGTGPDEAYLIELAKYYKIEGKVNFCGQVGDINKVWQHNHILLMPSLGEGKPLALEEAIFCGRPAVVTDVAGNCELIEDGVNGYVSSSHFVSSFNEALENAWITKYKWEEMGKIGHEKIIDSTDYNPKKTILTIIESDLYE